MDLDYEVIADNLDRAADLIWMYGRNTCPDPAENAVTHCVLEAVSSVKGTSVWMSECGSFGGVGSPEAMALEWTIATRGLFPQQRGCPGLTAAMWNDSLPVNPENDGLVIDTMRRTAKAVRALAPQEAF